MKKIYLLFFVFILWKSTVAQTELWGYVHSKNMYSNLIFRTDGNGENQQIVFDSYPTSSIGSNFCTLLESFSGKLYGTTFKSLFSYDIQTNELQLLHSFDDEINGKSLCGGVIQATNGKIYGMTEEGGINNSGTIYEYNPVSNTLTKIYDFDNVGGRRPAADLLEVYPNELYGVTKEGGINNLGILFKINANTHQVTKLIDFDMSCPNGESTLMKASNGNLYGYAWGKLYEYNPNNNQITVLYDSLAIDCCCSYHKMVEPVPGKLYGTTCSGGTNNSGLIFEYDLNTNSFTPVFSFLDSVSGEVPYGRMLYTNGVLYGMTYYGGNNNDGVIYQYDFVNQIFTKLFDFFNCDSSGTFLGGNPVGGLVEAMNGKLYGLTQSSLFEFDAQQISVISLKNNSNLIGRCDYGEGLVQAKNNNLFGISNFGGSCGGYGILFEINPVNNNFAVKHFFNYLEDITPRGIPVSASDGKLYGTTSSGGYNNSGTLYRYDVDSGLYTKLADFEYNITGSLPSGQLLQADNGNFYGMTMNGGTYNKGTIFEYNILTDSLKNIYDFDSISGQLPFMNGLIQANDGKLYGLTTRGGQYDKGVLFCYDLINSDFYKISDLDSNLGCNPFCTLLKIDSGKLCGLCSHGGAYNFGTIIEYNIATQQLTKVFDFDSINSGYSPLGSLIKTSNGLLFGYALGGDSARGIMFSFNPETSNFQIKIEFDFTNGSFPLYAQLLEINSTGIDVQDNEINVGIFPSPANKFVTLTNVKNASLSIYNEMGINVYRKTNLHSNEIINISQFSSGVYLFKIQCLNQQIITKKIVFQTQ